MHHSPVVAASARTVTATVPTVTRARIEGAEILARSGRKGLELVRCRAVVKRLLAGIVPISFECF